MKATETKLDRFLSQNYTQFLIPIYQINYDLGECKDESKNIILVSNYIRYYLIFTNQNNPNKNKFYQ